MFELIKSDTRFELVGKQTKFLAFSGLLLLASILAVVFIGPTYGIDFKGGSDIILQFEKDVEADNVRKAADQVLPDVVVQRYGSEEENRFLVQTRAVSVMDEKKAEKVEKNLQGLGDVKKWEWSIEQPNRAEVTFASQVDPSKIKSTVEKADLQHVEVKPIGMDGIHRYEIRFEDLQRYVVESFAKNFGDAFNPTTGLERMETVGARVGEQFRNAGILSILVALLFILIYIAFRFDVRYAPGAVAALGHDVIIAVGFFTVAGIEVSLPIIAALLTIVGYSLNDTIVVFDRIRENFESSTSEGTEELVNRSLNETLSRTIITSLTTLLAVVAIAVLGGGLIRDFAIALIVGVVIGTYSSVFVASPIMIRMDNFLRARREADEILETQKSKTPVA
ncbi:protein translocase subunit SecF [Persicimonas caeni]|uniref:Protein-export membrane protein SecF n=1 Tax=Persicimonas caeni TaxID=2292766 RepID=A0A4Y6Q2Y4_PERCE|nr:protein translocase subunit SecF [Persicimonas caeni]QDG54537.1 protein translocase subunit SecF [Persicimonas caeni]QED35758.1 protein translocase subunit SecF [Persicimonas caeni]